MKNEKKEKNNNEGDNTFYDAKFDTVFKNVIACEKINIY